MRRFASAVGAVAIVGSAFLASAPSAHASNVCANSGSKKYRMTATYTVNGSPVAKLQGHTHLGDTIAATFTIPAQCADVPVVLASYNAFNPPPNTLSQASQQTLFSGQGTWDGAADLSSANGAFTVAGTYGPGTYTVTAKNPPGLAPSPSTKPIKGTTVPWTGHGSENLPCQSGAHWVLSPSSGVTAASLTVNGVTYQMSQSGKGSWSANSGGPLDSTVTASATFQGTGTPSLQLSDCPHFQLDFVQHSVENPPQYRLSTVPGTTLGVVMSSDSA